MSNLLLREQTTTGQREKKRIYKFHKRNGSITIAAIFVLFS